MKQISKDLRKTETAGAVVVAVSAATAAAVAGNTAGGFSQSCKPDCSEDRVLRFAEQRRCQTGVRKTVFGHRPLLEDFPSGRSC